MSNATIPGWGGLPAASSYLVTYDYDSNSWSNDTGPDDIPRAEGSMVFIPAADGGILVYVGGITDLSGNGTAIQGQSLAKIILLDIINAKWYIQDATGDVPDMRRRFCMDVYLDRGQIKLQHLSLWRGGHCAGQTSRLRRCLRSFHP